MSLKNMTIKGHSCKRVFENLKPPLSDVEKLKAVEDEDWHLLTETHMGLGCSIAGRYVSRGADSDEMVSAAMLGICDAVGRIPQLKHNNITGYIVSYIHRYCSDVWRNDTAVSVPNGVVPLPTRGNTDKGVFDFNTVEFHDSLDSIVNTQLEIDIVALRRLGCTDAEVAEQLDVCRTTVTRVRNQLKKRFEQQNV